MAQVSAPSVLVTLNQRITLFNRLGGNLGLALLFIGTLFAVGLGALVARETAFIRGMVVGQATLLDTSPIGQEPRWADWRVTRTDGSQVAFRHDQRSWIQVGRQMPIYFVPGDLEGARFVAPDLTRGAFMYWIVGGFIVVGLGLTWRARRLTKDARAARKGDETSIVTITRKSWIWIPKTFRAAHFVHWDTTLGAKGKTGLLLAGEARGYRVGDRVKIYHGRRRDWLDSQIALLKPDKTGTALDSAAA